MTINSNAPVRCKKQILIKAKPEKVWKVLTDIDNWPKWQANVSLAKINGSLTPKTTFHFKAGGAKIYSELHTVKPYTSLGWTGKVFGIFAVHNWRFKNVNEGTEVHVEESMEGILAKVFKGWMNKVLEKEMIKSLKLLKTECEKK